MDIFGNLDRLREFSYDTTVNQDVEASKLTNPGDHALRGNKPNFPINSAGGRRMAGGGIMSAIAGELSPHLVEPARKILQPAVNFIISETTGVGIPTPTIASR